MTTYLTVREIMARLGVSDESVRRMLRSAGEAIRTQPSTPKTICWEDVLAWRNGAPQRRAATPWQIESRAHFEARTAGRKDRQMNGSMSERLDR